MNDEEVVVVGMVVVQKMAGRRGVETLRNEERPSAQALPRPRAAMHILGKLLRDNQPVKVRLPSSLPSSCACRSFKRDSY